MLTANDLRTLRKNSKTPEDYFSWLPNEDLLLYAGDFSSYSNCEKMHYGALVIDTKSLKVGIGCNASIRESKCCVRRDITSGTRLERCYAVHAEQAAILNFHDKPVGDLVMYIAGYHPSGVEWVSHLSCSFCARIMYAAGIKHVVMRSEEGILIQTIDEAVDSSFIAVLG